MGLIFFLFPKAAPWLGAALVLGALYAAETEAKNRNQPGPLASLGFKVTTGETPK